MTRLVTALILVQTMMLVPMAKKLVAKAILKWHIIIQVVVAMWKRDVTVQI